MTKKEIIELGKRINGVIAEKDVLSITQLSEKYGFTESEIVDILDKHK